MLTHSLTLLTDILDLNIANTDLYSWLQLQSSASLRNFYSRLSRLWGRLYLVTDFKSQSSLTKRNTSLPVVTIVAIKRSVIQQQHIKAWLFVHYHFKIYKRRVVIFTTDFMFISGL